MKEKRFCKLARSGRAWHFVIAAFPAGEANGHHLINNSDRVVTYLEIGDRTKGDQVTYPDADLSAKMTEQGWQFIE